MRVFHASITYLTLVFVAVGVDPLLHLPIPLLSAVRLKTPLGWAAARWTLGPRAPALGDARPAARGERPHRARRRRRACTGSGLGCPTWPTCDGAPHITSSCPTCARPHRVQPTGCVTGAAHRRGRAGRSSPLACSARATGC